MRQDQSMRQNKNNNMVKSIHNFDKVYGEKIFPSNGMIYTIEKASIVKTNSEPQLIEYFDIKGFDMYNNHKPAEYSVGIFYDTNNNQNLACVYKRGESSSVFTDKGMSSVHFKTIDIFKTYIVTLINRAL
jgi:hypothetical protein